MENKMVMTLKWKDLGKDVKIPTKRVEDAGFDIYAYEEEDIVLRPHETRLFCTGLVSMFSADWFGLIKERGSTGTNGIAVRAGVIDSGYRGEWKIALTNENDYPILFSKTAEKVEVLGKGRKKKLVYPMKKAIAQVVFVPVPNYVIKPLTDADLANDSSERGKGGWGASGK